MGVQGLSLANAFLRARAVNPDVLHTDLGLLEAADLAVLAHARHRQRTRDADARVLEPMGCQPWNRLIGFAGWQPAPLTSWGQRSARDRYRPGGVMVRTSALRS